MMSRTIFFNKFKVNHEVFFTSKFSYLLVNIKPLVPGHVMVVPFRVVPKLKDLTPEESQDLFETLQKVHRFIEHVYKADSLNIGIQDGKLLGQSVPHVHIHIIPRYFTDGTGDKIYDQMEDNEQEIGNLYTDRLKLNQSDSQRVNRSDEEMTLEANWLKQEYAKYVQDH